ncbi:MAG: DUF3298 and DUF4163 domain-containing protein [Candidatus Cellulosilyticum pullistercoris]|uniref:DUF3298 and DUF4163 domain-containing protein n=1 Tax=Candidatus Cellulosilyticum pullistercoris TaxID=2838521 RepID=A0A9E2NLE1_9FIRM|nr:DUF3298 and DUF4163 domain-containing protein [Candidatus Cellulosilyticum pullistercoris]
MKNKTILKAMYVLEVILLVCPSLMAAKVKSPRPTPGAAIFVMSHMNPISIESKQFDYSNDGLKLNMKIPQLHGLKDSKFEKDLNNKLIEDAKKRKNKMIKEAMLYNQDIIKDGLSPIAFEYIESYAIIPSLNPYYAIEMFKYQYSGGAHGISNVDYLVLNTETSKIIGLKDLFKETVDYKSILNDQIRKQIDLRTKAGEYFFTGSDGFQGIKENQPFFINEKGDLIIVFNVYEIAPYAAGTIFFTLPYQDLSSYMK